MRMPLKRPDEIFEPDPRSTSFVKLDAAGHHSKTIGATGTVAGTVSNFDWSADVASSLPETVALTSDTYAYAPEGCGHSYQTDENGVVRGMPNIFDSPWRGQRSSWPRGHVIGATAADVDGTQWYGEWHGAFFGNRALPTDHPTSIAGTFTVSGYGESGLAGGFGVHRSITE